MKAERRHELKTNTLASGLEHFPETWKEYGSKILLTILIAAITFLLVRYWRESVANREKQIVAALENARAELATLKQLPLQIGGGAPASVIADQRQRLAQQADQSLGSVLNSSKTTSDLTAAYRIRGDLNWTLANFPELPGADTQPSLQVSNRDALLDQAKTSYEKVLESPSAPTTFDVFYAHMGLAAIAENQKDWSKAQSQYDAIANDTKMPEQFKQDARDQAARLKDIQSPVLIVQAPQAAPAPPPATPTTSGMPAPSLGPEAPAILSPPTTAAVNFTVSTTQPQSVAFPVLTVPGGSSAPTSAATTQP